MSVLAFDFYSEDDPNGTPLGTLDDADCKSMEFRPALHELGSGIFTVSRHHTDATSTLIREDNLVKVRVPSVSTDPIFAFWLKEGDFTLIDTNEQGGEDLTFGGPSLLHILSQARLYHSSMVSDQPNRGSINVPGMWTWVNEPYGAILTRLIEEGRESPFPDAAAAGSALEHVTITFDRVNDSDGNPWPDITETFQTPIGSDMLSVAERLSAAGDLYLVMDPDLTLHAYQTYGRDLSGSFGSGTVRFEKGVNILTQLVRKIEARQMITHLLQQDKDKAYSTEVDPGYTPGQRKHWGYFEASQTNDDTQLNKIAQNVIAASRTSGQIVELEYTPGFVPASGRYMPGPEGTSGHFWLGDTVTLHTGAGQHDYNAVDQTVIAFRVVLDEASVDTTDDTAARSLHIVPELNHQHIRGFANELGNPGFCCGPVPPTPTVPPGDPTPGATGWSYTWNFESNNLDTGTGTVHFMLGRENAPGTLTSWWGSSGGGSNAGLYEKQAVTAGGAVNVAGKFAKNRLSTLSVSWFKINWFADILDVNPVSSTTIGIAASGSKPGVFATVASSTTVPAGIEAITIQVDNNLFADDLTISHTGAATPGTAGTAGNGLPEIIGSGNVYMPINARDYILRTSAPTETDDEEHGFPVGTKVRVVDDTDNPTVIYERWFLLDNTDGAAVWVLDLSGDASTVPYDGALTDLAAENVQDAIDELENRVDDLEVTTGTPADDYLLNTGGEAAKLVTVADAGAAYEVNLDGGNAFDLTLTEACTVTFAGLTNARLCEWTIYWRGSFGITWPASVQWTEGSAPSAPASGKYHVVTFQSIDGGTNIQATYGGSAASALNDLSDVTITAAATGDMLRFDGTAWVDTPGRWEPVTTNPGTGPELVWSGDEILMTWVNT